MQIQRSGWDQANKQTLRSLIDRTVTIKWNLNICDSLWREDGVDRRMLNHPGCFNPCCVYGTTPSLFSINASSFMKETPSKQQIPFAYSLNLIRKIPPTKEKATVIFSFKLKFPWISFTVHHKDNNKRNTHCHFRSCRSRLQENSC